MDYFILFVIENWSSILEKAMIFLAYFFVFLYKKKMQNTRTVLTTEYKTNRKAFSDYSDKLEKKYQENYRLFNEKVGEIEEIQRKLARHEQALKILTTGDIKHDSREIREDVS